MESKNVASKLTPFGTPRVNSNMKKRWAQLKHSFVCNSIAIYGGWDKIYFKSPLSAVTSFSCETYQIKAF